MLIIAMLVLVTVSGCSALIAATGTSEDDIIHTGSTSSELIQRLGDPIKVEALDAPVRVWDVLGREPQITLLVEQSYTRDSSGKIVFHVPENEAISKAYFRFVGRLKRTHDVGEAVSVDLMTLGVAELFMAPAVATDRAVQREHILVVWLDKSDVAVAYQWIDSEAPSD